MQSHTEDLNQVMKSTHLRPPGPIGDLKYKDFGEINSAFPTIQFDSEYLLFAGLNPDQRLMKWNKEGSSNSMLAHNCGKGRICSDMIRHHFPHKIR